MTAEAQKQGYIAYGIDYANNKDRPRCKKYISFDLRFIKEVERFRQWFYAKKADGRVVHVHLGPPCGTATRARDIRREGVDPKPLRSDEYPDGLQNLPPKDAEVFTTGCDYCIAGCGYKVFRWPVRGKNGGPKASQNALGVDLPTATLSGSWISPSMHNVVTADGKKQNVIVLPDPDMKHVNKGGDHSIRGGCIAQKCYNPDTPTRDRLQYPQLRVNGKLERISWDDATDIMAQVSEYVLEKFGVHAWGMKAYSYEFWIGGLALLVVDASLDSF